MGLLNPTQGRERNFFHSLTRFVKPLDGPIWGIKYLLLPLMPINTRDHNGRLNYTSFIPNSFHCTGDWNCLHFSCSYKDHISNQRSSNQISLTFNPIKSSTVLSPFLLQSDNWAIIFSTNIKHITSEVKFLKLIRYSIDRSGHYWKDKRISDNLMILYDLSDSTVWPVPFPLLTTVSNLRLAGEKYSSQYFPTQSVSGNSIQCSDIWCLLHSIGCFKSFFLL